MIHENTNIVSTMWYENDRIKRAKGEHLTKFNVRKGTKLNDGDLVFFGKDKNLDKNRYWKIESIVSKRQSTLSAFNYVEAMCTFASQ